MAEVHIQIGATDGYRYIGIQPPLSDRQMTALRDANYTEGNVPTHFSLRAPHIGEPYSETGITTAAYEPT